MFNENLERKEFNIRIIFKIIFIILLIFYVIYHIYSGNYGFKSYITKQERLTQKNLELIKIEKEIATQKHKIENLQDNNLDSDLLDEEIRKDTGYAKKNEIIMYSDELNKSN